MLHSGKKREAFEEMQAAYERLSVDVNFCNYAGNRVIKTIKEIQPILQEIEDYSNTLDDYQRRANYTVTFQPMSDTGIIKPDNNQAGAIVVSGVGTAIGAGIATFGSSTLMAAATAFGTASTGAAISSLSGVAATNAALALIGGGTLAAGGGGVAGGTALLTALGPIGWAVAGVSLVGGGILADQKNRKAIEEAEKWTKEYDRRREKARRLKVKLDNHNQALKELVKMIKPSLKYLSEMPFDVRSQVDLDEEKEMYGHIEQLFQELKEAKEACEKMG